MANAIKSVRPALESFYAALDDEQKARFNMMGPPLSDPIDRQIRHAGRQRSAALQRLVIDFVKRLAIQLFGRDDDSMAITRL